MKVLISVLLLSFTLWAVPSRSESYRNEMCHSPSHKEYTLSDGSVLKGSPDSQYDQTTSNNQFPSSSSLVHSDSSTDTASDNLPAVIRNENGSYEIRIGHFNGQWGDPSTMECSIGTPHSFSEKDRDPVQHAQLIAQSEIKRNQWTSASELNLFFSFFTEQVEENRQFETGMQRMELNISSGVINITVSSADNIEIELCEPSGRKIIRHDLAKENNQLNLNNLNLPSGIYHLKLNGVCGIESSRLLIK